MAQPISAARPLLAVAGDAHVRSDPTPARPLEKGTQPANLSFISLGASRFHLAPQGQEALMQGDLFRSRFMAVIEGFVHRRRLRGNDLG
jgi:hypothetical protein